MQAQAVFCILPIDDKSIDGDATTVERITVTLEASTKAGEYRCRKAGHHAILVEDASGDEIYSITYEGIDEHWYGGREQRSTTIPPHIGESIADLFTVGCPYGKYPEPRVSLQPPYYNTLDVDYDDDGSRGTLCAKYELFITRYEHPKNTILL